MGVGAFRRGEVVAPGDLTPLIAQAAQATHSLRLCCVHSRGCLGSEIGVLRGAGGSHLLDELELLGLGGRRRDPDPGLAAPLEDLIGKPLQMLPRPGVVGQGNDIVGELGHPESFELAP